MNLPTLYELQSDDEEYDTLTFVVSYTAEQEPIYPPSAIAFQDCFNRRPLSEDWSPPPVVIERDEQRTDIYAIESCFAVNERAKQALSRLIGPHAEFLPVEVIGERDVDEDTEGHRPIARPPKLYLVNPLIEVELGKGSISNILAHRHITKYVFHPDDLLDLPIFRAKEDLCILVSDSFRQLADANGLRGLQFEDEFEWQGSTSRASTTGSTAASKRPQERVAPPELISEEELSNAKQMSQDWWQNAQQHWQWICDATTARDGSVDQKLEVPNLSAIDNSLLSKERLAANCHRNSNTYLRTTRVRSVSRGTSWEAHSRMNYPETCENAADAPQISGTPRRCRHWPMWRLINAARMMLSISGCRSSTWERGITLRLICDTGPTNVPSFI